MKITGTCFSELSNCEYSLAKLLFGGIAAASTPQSFPENDEVL
jgi:hypothetical protein